MNYIAARVTLLAMVISMVACKPKPAQVTTDQQDSTTTTTTVKDTIVKASKTPEYKQDQMTFVAYDDDGDYAQLFAKKGGDLYNFINEGEDRSLLRGDQIQIKWKRDTITIAGDGESPEPADVIVSVRKIADGAVSKFRKRYDKPVKYTWAPKEGYSQYYLDKVYKLVEYYLANTQSELIRRAIGQKEELTYSMESADKDGKKYTMIGVAVPGTQGSNIVQWLYIDKESHELYEYDMGEDKLVRFDK
ncbi:hypothetical protein LLH06_19320 [Mucilaginibacter daejeonensis]|uniref:hypothetical protein n=1 Tax=Mucilaginibacter daejeonensis TaxID=398049 RepID=UPI001D173050|nr:hypothetical protein [Mucilaginibacter daejeonensis]UEG53098.1 hypothetical protein LLH06_19320 [Mucilaginibacter daejeonensis]